MEMFCYTCDDRLGLQELQIPAIFQMCCNPAQIICLHCICSDHLLDQYSRGIHDKFSCTQCHRLLHCNQIVNKRVLLEAHIRKQKQRKQLERAAIGYNARDEYYVPFREKCADDTLSNSLLNGLSQITLQDKRWADPELLSTKATTNQWQSQDSRRHASNGAKNKQMYVEGGETKKQAVKFQDFGLDLKMTQSIIHHPQNAYSSSRSPIYSNLLENNQPPTFNPYNLLNTPETTKRDSPIFKKYMLGQGLNKNSPYYNLHLQYMRAQSEGNTDHYPHAYQSLNRYNSPSPQQFEYLSLSPGRLQVANQYSHYRRATSQI